MNLHNFRQMTTIPPEYAYFQTSGFSPKLTPVVDEVERLNRLVSQGPALPHIAGDLGERFEATRQKVARSLNADADEIVLGENATIGINIVANGIDWQPGDNVLLSTHEHPGNRIPWYAIARRYGVELRFLPMGNDEEILLDNFERMLDARTRLVSISHVSRQTGLRVPGKQLAQMAHAKDVPVLYDGAQSFGAIPVDLHGLDCDFYAFSGHKYIMAPQGTGGCYIRRDRIEWIKPSWIGSHSEKVMDNEGGMILLDEAKRYEFGTRNLADQAGFGMALDIWAELGWENVFAAIAAYTDRLKAAVLDLPGVELLTPLPYEQSSGIVSVSVPGYDTRELSASLLEKEKVLVSSLEAGSSNLRISTHVFNTQEEADRLVSGLRRIVTSGL